MAVVVDRMDHPLPSKRRVLDHQILTSFLEGSSWEGAFETFFLRHAEVFAGFSVGSEYSLQQTEIHMTFLSSAEALLDGRTLVASARPKFLSSQDMRPGVGTGTSSKTKFLLSFAPPART